MDSIAQPAIMHALLLESNSSHHFNNNREAIWNDTIVCLWGWSYCVTVRMDKEKKSQMSNVYYRDQG